MKRIMALAIFMLIMSADSIFSKELTGRVFGIDPDNNKNPLPSANIFWLGTKTGAVTDHDGRFKIEAPYNSNKLVATYTGYKRDTILIAENISAIEIILKSSLRTKEIHVTAEEPSLMITRSEPVKSEIITGRGLKKAACCNLSESFITNPSVDVNYSDAVTGAKQIQLLGLSGIYTQMLSEKTPNLKGLAAAYGMSFIPGPWMESIQISKGTASVQTGYESITGQICMEYKNPASGEPLFVNIYANHLGRLEGNLVTSYQFNDLLSTNFLFNGNILKTKVDDNGDSFLDTPMNEQINLMNRWLYQGSNARHILTAKILYEDREAGQIGFYESGNEGFYGINIKTERYNVFGKSGYVFDTPSYNSIGFIYSGTIHRQNSIFGNRLYNARQNSFYFNMIYETGLGLNLENHHDETKDTPRAEHEDKLTFGLSYQFDEFDETAIDTLLYRQETVPGVFAEFTTHLFSVWTIVGGLRYDKHNLYGDFISPRIHTRFQLIKDLVFRASVGKGYRVANVVAENSGLLASGRKFVFEKDLKPEEAWNFGFNGTYDFSIFDIPFTFSSEYYRTNFENQVIVDMDRRPDSVFFHNLNGISYSNALQIDLNFQPVKRLEITAAYRLIDVWYTMKGKMYEKPLQSRNRAFLNFAYSTELNDWQFDLTINYNGSGRLPNTTANPEEYRLGSEFPDYYMLYAQITKKLGDWDLYVGGENLTNFIQQNPIIAANDPFGKYFDSSIVWGPIIGQLYYFGVRYSL